MSTKKPIKKRTRIHSNWCIDYDYWYQLSEEEKAWLDKFNDEYYRNIFDTENSIHDLDEPVEYEIRNGVRRKNTRKQQLMYAECLRKRDILVNECAPYSKKNPNYSPKLYIDREIVVDEDKIIDKIDKEKQKLRAKKGLRDDKGRIKTSH